ncbi:MAG: hypothetical protein IKX51_01715 [Bacteroidales bacterium]|nr:hypothetical protein [Bacteroidales bacterium]
MENQLDNEKMNVQKLTSATVSLILGILSLLFVLYIPVCLFFSIKMMENGVAVNISTPMAVLLLLAPFLSFAMSIVGIVLSIKALVRCRKNTGLIRKKKVAKTGLILSIVGLVLTVLIFIIVIAIIVLVLVFGILPWIGLFLFAAIFAIFS